MSERYEKRGRAFAASRLLVHCVKPSASATLVRLCGAPRFGIVVVVLRDRPSSWIESRTRVSRAVASATCSVQPRAVLIRQVEGDARAL